MDWFMFSLVAAACSGWAADLVLSRCPLLRALRRLSALKSCADMDFRLYMCPGRNLGGSPVTSSRAGGCKGVAQTRADTDRTHEFEGIP
jgi:hypothetical protein